MTARAIATWDFGMLAVAQAIQTLDNSGQKNWSLHWPHQLITHTQKKGSALEAVVAGVSAVELDPTITSVGYGGDPNCLGQVPP